MIRFCSDTMIDSSPSWTFLNGVYLHGKVEGAFDYDLVRVATDELEDFLDSEETGCDGVECEVAGYPGKTLLFLWSSDQEHKRNGFHRGFIVDADDAEAVKHAREKFNEKAFTI